MKAYLVLVLLAAVLVGVYSTEIEPTAAALFSSRDVVPRNWIMGEHAPLDAEFTFKIFLKQRNIESFQDLVSNMSDPTSEHWLKFLNIDQILDIVAPEPKTIQPLIQWLNQNGVKPNQIQNFRDSLLISTTVSVTRSLFHAKIYTFTHNTKPDLFVHRVFGASFMPQNLIHLIDVITGLDDFPATKRSPRFGPVPFEPTAPVVSAGMVVPSVIRNVYNVPERSVTHPKSSVGLIQFMNEGGFSYADLKTFQEQTGSIATPVTKVVGPFDSTPQAESTLDVQYSAAIADNTTIWFWTVKGWLLDFSQDFFNAKEVPLIISISWGWTENEMCQVTTCKSNTTNESYVARVNVEWSKIAARGVSVFTSSGDTGAYGPANNYCSPLGPITLGPLFPTDSPFVTSVGATMLVKSSETQPNSTATPPICQKYHCATSTMEGVCTIPEARITTGGGFSVYSPIQNWQATHVNQYLSSGVSLPPSNYYHRYNRAFPDISALGHNYLIFIQSAWQAVDGTSCSSPVMGAMMALINDKRMNAGKKSIGFVAPLLYKLYEQKRTAFRTVAAGNNKCTEVCCGKYGYENTGNGGWNPVTGLGTPNFPEMEAYLFSLP